MRCLVTILLFAYAFLCRGQTIYVVLRIEKLSPLITSYSKSEMEAMLRDSIKAQIARGFIRRTEKERPITFNKDQDHEYVVELILTDTVNLNIPDSIQTPERLRLVRLASLHYRVYEKGLDAGLIPKFDWFGVGYSDRDGKLQNGHTEEDVIRTYSSWVGSIFSGSILSQIPYLETYTLTQFNVSQEESRKFDSFKEVLITKTNFDSSKHVAIVDRLLTDALLRAQEFYYGIRSKKSNYINIYDAYNESFTDHPIKLEFVLNTTENGYQMRLIIDENLITKHPNYHVPKIIEFSNEQLEQAPSQVLHSIHDMLSKLFRLNLE